MFQKIIPAVIDATKAAGAKTFSSVTSMTDGLDKTITTAKGLSGKFGEFSSLRKELNGTLAQSSVERSLGRVNNYQSALEECRQKLIDPSFQNIDFLKRMKMTYVPSKFPSGYKIAFKKSQLNSIDSALSKNKKINIEFTNKNGEIINAVFIPKQAHLGEECHRVLIKRTLPNGVSEKVSSSYFPKSSEIRLVETGLDGSKVFSSIVGGAQKAEMKSAKVSSQKSQKVIETDKFLKAFN